MQRGRTAGVKLKECPVCGEEIAIGALGMHMKGQPCAAQKRINELKKEGWACSHTPALTAACKRLGIEIRRERTYPASHLIQRWVPQWLRLLSDSEPFAVGGPGSRCEHASLHTYTGPRRVMTDTHILRVKQDPELQRIILTLCALTSPEHHAEALLALFNSPASSGTL